MIAEPITHSIMPHIPYSCIWLDGAAQEAASFYTSVFPDSRMLDANPMVCTLELLGTRFMLLNGGPQYRPNPAVSYMAYCGSQEEVTRMYEALTDGGQVLMPLGAYDWSPHYAFVQDRYGVAWQLDPDTVPIPRKIAPTLLFANEKMGLVAEALSHYEAIFPEFRRLMEAPHQPGPGIPEGALLFAQCKLNGALMNMMDSPMRHDFDFTPGNSMVVNCDSQEEIDHYWEKLGAGGFFSMCGWLQDRFGVSWQVVPAVLPKLMADPERAPRVVAAFRKMQKFEIALLENA